MRSDANRDRMCDAMGDNQDRECVIFLHIPKTAGQTLNGILARQYDPAATVMIEDPSDPWTPFSLVSERRPVVLVRGHVPYGIHEALKIKAVYITMLRRPVARVISIYQYIKRTPEHPLHQLVQDGELTLSAFIESGIDREETVDGQTRLLAGLVDRDPDEHTLAIAIANLKRIAVAGLTERFDESVLLFRRRLAWQPPFYKRKNVAPGRSRVEAPLPDELELIAQTNRLDSQLYEAARRMFERRVAAAGVTFRAERVAFRQLNRLANGYRLLRGAANDR